MESLVSPLDFFRLLVQDENTIPLFEAAASIATDADPTLDLEQLRTTFDVMAIRLGIEARNASTENARLGCLLRQPGRAELLRALPQSNPLRPLE